MDSMNVLEIRSMIFIGAMNFIFTDKDLLRLYIEEAGPRRKSLPNVIIDRFFEAMAEIAVASDERELRSLKSRRMEKVPSECKGCYSVRLNDQFRLIFRFTTIDEKIGIEIIDVRDYH